MSTVTLDKDANIELDKLGMISLVDTNEFENQIDLSSNNNINNSTNIANYSNVEQQLMMSPMAPVSLPKQFGYSAAVTEQTNLELQKQLEYYFSTKNLQNDSYLRSQMDSEDYVAISLIAQFKRIKQLTNDTNLIVNVIRQSSQLQLDATNTRLRSVGGSSGGLITINTTNYTKKTQKFFANNSASVINNADQQNAVNSSLQLQQQQQRCVLILREVAPEATLEQIKELFTKKEPDCPACHACESAGNDSWYVTFNNEEQAQKALQYLKIEVQTFMEKPIRARIKAHTTIPRSTSSLLNTSNAGSKMSSMSPSSPPPSQQQQQQQQQILSTQSTLPVNYSQQLLAYDTPPSSSYMSQTSSPSPAPVYPAATANNTTLQQELAGYHHDATHIQLVQMSKPNSDFDMHQSNNSNFTHISTQQTQQQQQFNYFNSNQNTPPPSHLKYLPNGKPLNLMGGNQHYMFSPGPPINSPNGGGGGSRPILAQSNNQYWQLNNTGQVYTTTPQKQILKYNNDDNTSPNQQANISANKQASTSTLSLNNNNNSADTFKQANDSTDGEATKSFVASPNPIENHATISAETSQSAYSAASNAHALNPQSILQIPNYYQPQQQQPQMIQIPLHNSNTYNRSSPAAIQSLFYQSTSQQPHQQHQQQYIPLIPPQSTSNSSQQPILSSTSSSSLNGQSVVAQPGQAISYSSMQPGVGYQQQPQFIIQNTQYLNHQNISQPAQISIISNSVGGQLIGGPGITLNSNYYNSNSATAAKSSTPTPAAPTTSGSSSNNTLSGSSNGPPPQQITSPPIYNTNSYFIATNNNSNSNNNIVNNNNTNTNGTVSAAAIATYQYYQSMHGYPNQHSNQQQQHGMQNIQNQVQPNYHQGMQTAHMYPAGNQPQPHSIQQSMPIFYEIVQSQYDGTSNALSLTSFPSQLQNLSQSNLSNETAQIQSTKSTSENVTNATNTANSSNPSNTANNASAVVVASAPVQFGNQHSSSPAVFIYNTGGNPQHNLIINQLNSATSSASAAAAPPPPAQLLMTSLGSGGTPNSQPAANYNHSSGSNSTNPRRANSGNSNSGSAEPRNSSFGGYQPNNNNSYRSYATNNPRVKYMNNSSEPGLVSNQHHSNSANHHHHPSHSNYAQNMSSPSTYQSNNNKTYHQSVNSSNSHSIVSESTTSSSRSSTSNTPMTVASGGNLNNSDSTNNKQSSGDHESTATIEKPTQASKSPPNNSDLVSFPPLLNTSNIPVNNNNQQRQTTPANQSSESSELASVQLDPAIICISNSTLPSSPAIINAVNTKYANTKAAGSLNKILATASATEHSTVSESSNNSSTNQTSTPVTSVKHQGNIKYEMIKSHLGYNRTPHLSTSSNPDYYSKQANNNNTNSSSNTQHHHQMHQGSPSNQIYTNNNSIYKSTGASGSNYSRKSIDGLHSQNTATQRMHQSHHSGGASVSGKFYSNNNNERSSSTGGGGGASSGSSGNKNHGRQNFPSNNQAENKPTLASSPAHQAVLGNENNQHTSSPSFNRKQKGSSNTHPNKGHSAQNYKDSSPKSSNEHGGQKHSNTNSQTNVTDSSNLIAQSNSSLMSSSSSLQNNEDDMNSQSNNSWSNKKLTFAEIVQQKANSVNGSDTKAGQAVTGQQEASSGCFSNTSSVSITSANSSIATTPTIQPQVNSPFVLTTAVAAVANANSFTDSSDPSVANDQSQKSSCFALNQSNSTTLTNSSIQV